MNGHTKGRVEATGNGVHLLGGRCVALTHMEPKEQRDADARLIAEAFNTYTETGRTPAQLTAERAELVAALAELVSAIEAEVNENGAGGFLLARLTDASAILAKVKGPVQ